jgi:hypothetical protein
MGGGYMKFAMRRDGSERYFFSRMVAGSKLILAEERRPSHTTLQCTAMGGMYVASFTLFRLRSFCSISTGS